MCLYLYQFWFLIVKFVFAREKSRAFFLPIFSNPAWKPKIINQSPGYSIILEDLMYKTNFLYASRLNCTMINVDLSMIFR